MSDVHCNLEALQECLKVCERRKVDRILFIGDAVGYGASPNQCVSLLRKEADIMLAGNHDYGAVGKTDTNYFNIYAREAIEWTSRVLNPDNFNFLRSMPLVYEEDDMLFVHSTPESPADWDYIMDADDIVRNFRSFDKKICFVGHSHVPIIFIENEKGEIHIEATNRLTISKRCKYIINVGSIGQPRDGDPRASFGIYDTDLREFELVRAEYDIKRSQEKILLAGLPAFLASRLAVGR